MAVLRDEILRPGRYASVPHCVLASIALKSSDKLVYQILLDHLGKNDVVWPSQATIARRTALSIRGVRRAIKRLTAIGLIFYDNIGNTSNHYTFSNPEVVLNTQAEADSLSDSSQCGGGHADRIPPVTLTVYTDKMTGVPGHADHSNTVTLTPKPLQGTTSVNHITEATSVELPHSPKPLAAAERDEHIANLEQGDVEMNPTNLDLFRSLLKLWTQRKQPPPKHLVKTFYQVLAVQQEKVGTVIDPVVVSAAADLDLPFAALFEADGDGRFCWHQLQTVGRNRKLGKAAGQIQKAMRKTGSASLVEEIYQAYPKKVGKDAAKKAIVSAIRKLNAIDQSQDAAAWLLERTKLYAASRVGQEQRFTPHPANWFNRGSYADDEQEWGVTENRSGNIKRVIIEEDHEPGETLQDFCKRTHNR